MRTREQTVETVSTTLTTTKQALTEAGEVADGDRIRELVASHWLAAGELVGRFNGCDVEISVAADLHTTWITVRPTTGGGDAQQTETIFDPFVNGTLARVIEEREAETVIPAGPWVTVRIESGGICFARVAGDVPAAPPEDLPSACEPWIRETRDRVRAAIHGAVPGVVFPRLEVLLPGGGQDPTFDLPAAVAVMVALGKLSGRCGHVSPVARLQLDLGGRRLRSVLDAGVVFGVVGGVR